MVDINVNMFSKLDEMSTNVMIFCQMVLVSARGRTTCAARRRCGSGFSTCPRWLPGPMRIVKVDKVRSVPPPRSSSICGDVFDRLAQDALSKSQSVDLIRRAVEELT